MTEETDKQFAVDLKALEDASDKLDRELNKEPKPLLSNVGKVAEVEVEKPHISARASVLTEYNGVESDIPIGHAYWQMKG